VSQVQVALLRGINVGKAKRVAMADLRALVTDLGYRSVSTLLNSGNVVFEGDTARGESAARIEEALVTKLGVESRVTVLNAAELAQVVEENLLVPVATNPSRLLVAFPREPGRLAALASLAAGDWSPEIFALGERAAYLWTPEGVLASRLAEAVGRALGDGVTTRNWSTVLKLNGLAGGG
jgi:uncharacterized protein (DUF1697 family)